MSNHLHKLKDLQKRFNEQYNDMTDEKKKEFTNLILTGAIKREEANNLAEEILEDIQGGKEDGGANKRVELMTPAGTDEFKHCNHHHELTDQHEVVDFGDGEFVANKKAIPLLKALADLGIRTRTHHVDDEGGFFSILVDKPVQEVSIRQVNELSSSRTKYNGVTEVLVSFYYKKGENNA